MSFELSDLSPRERANERYPATLTPRRLYPVPPLAATPAPPTGRRRRTPAWYRRRALARTVTALLLAAGTVAALWLCIIAAYAAGAALATF